MTLARFAAPALALLLAAPAGAGTLVTPAMEPPSQGFLSCFVVNAGSKPRDVHIDIRGFDGTAPPLQSTDHSLDPGDAGGLAVQSNFARYCRFSFKGSAKSLRASIVMRDMNGETLAALEAR